MPTCREVSQSGRGCPGPRRAGGPAPRGARWPRGRPLGAASAARRAQRRRQRRLGSGSGSGVTLPLGERGGREEPSAHGQPPLPGTWQGERGTPAPQPRSGRSGARQRLLLQARGAAAARSGAERSGAAPLSSARLGADRAPPPEEEEEEEEEARGGRPAPGRPGRGVRGEGPAAPARLRSLLLPLKAPQSALRYCRASSRLALSPSRDFCYFYFFFPPSLLFGNTRLARRASKVSLIGSEVVINSTAICAVISRCNKTLTFPTGLHADRRLRHPRAVKQDLPSTPRLGGRDAVKAPLCVSQRCNSCTQKAFGITGWEFHEADLVTASVSGRMGHVLVASKHGKFF
ncbi:collagen alpha-1(XI) chain-like [Anser cygnoides]|uniref:collagen alpha-1(XI) chain-like n=1 Tax=Anser cygnoides TaxID=8845 RepID=UPI0034D3860D